MQVGEPHGLATGGLDVVPGLVGQALHVVRHIGGEVDNGGTEAFLRSHAAGDETAVQEIGKQGLVDLFQPHDRPGLVERPPRAQHSFHQRRLRAGEHVTNGALILHGRPQGMLDAAAVERGDGLELVERDRQALLAGGGDSSGQREHLGGQTRGVARGPDRRERQREARLAHRIGVEPKFGPHHLQQLAGPPAQAAGRGVGGDQCLGVGFKEADVRTGRRDRHLDGQDLLPGEAAQHIANQRRLAVAAR